MPARLPGQNRKQHRTFSGLPHSLVVSRTDGVLCVSLVGFSSTFVEGVAVWVSLQIPEHIFRMCKNHNQSFLKGSTMQVKARIDSEIVEVQELLATGWYHSVVWPSEKDSAESLPVTETSGLGEDVEKYIVEKLQALGEKKTHRVLSKITLHVFTQNIFFFANGIT